MLCGSGQSSACSALGCARLACQPTGGGGALGTYRRIDTRSEEAGCHAELESSGGEESRLTGCWMRDSSGYRLRMTGHQNQCGERLGPKKGQKMSPFFS